MRSNSRLARHLSTRTQEDVKRIFGHDPLKAYMALTQAQRVLGADEELALKAAGEIYAEKGFELR